MTELLPDERRENEVRCRICGRWVTWKQSRLWFTPEGTVRTCKKGLRPHDK